MIYTRRDTLFCIAVASLLVCAGLFLWLYHGGEHVRISDGSRVLLMYQMTIRGEEEAEAPQVAQFVQGQHQFLPALERVVRGKKTGDTLKVLLSEDESFGSYDVTKKKTIPRTDLPGGVKEGDVLKDRA